MSRAGVAFQVGFAMLLFAAFASRSLALSAAVLAIGVFYALASLPALWRGVRSDRQLLALMILGPLTLVALSVPRLGGAALFHIFVVLTMSAAAYGASRDHRVYWLASKWTLAVVQGVVLAYLAVVGVSGFPLEDLIPDSSSNGITSYLLVLQVNYCVVGYVLYRRFAWTTQLVTLFICVVGWGRGSILASSVLVLTSIAMSTLSRAHRSRVPALVFAALISVALWRYSEDISTFVEANTKIGLGLRDASRESILNEYLHGLTAPMVITGGSYDHTVIATDFSGNPHNSFIRAHHIFGLLYLLAVAVLPFASVRRTPPSVNRVYVLCLIGVVYFRAFTEPILFPTLLDFFFLGMCFVVAGAPPAGDAAQRAPERVRDATVPA